jgi:hypothetical protein
MKITRKEPATADRPTRRDLAAIEAEWPVIEAELDVLDVEITSLQTGDESSELTRRRLRRAQNHLTSVIANHARHSASAVDGVA